MKRVIERLEVTNDRGIRAAYRNFASAFGDKADRAGTAAGVVAVENDPEMIFGVAARERCSLKSDGTIVLIYVRYRTLSLLHRPNGRSLQNNAMINRKGFHEGR